MATINWAEVFPEIESFDDNKNWFVIDGPTENKLRMVAIAMRYCNDLQIKQAGFDGNWAWLLILNGIVTAGCHLIARDLFTSAGRFWGTDVSEWQKPPEFINGAMVL